MSSTSKYRVGIILTYLFVFSFNHFANAQEQYALLPQKFILKLDKDSSVVKNAIVKNLRTGFMIASDENGVVELPNCLSIDAITIAKGGVYRDTVTANELSDLDSFYIQTHVSKVIEGSYSKDETIDLINQVKKTRKFNRDKSKGYMLAHYYLGDQQTELSESYFNVQYMDYLIEDFDLKNGRLASIYSDTTIHIQKTNILDEILELDLFENNHWRYLPFDMSKSKIEKNFHVKPIEVSIVGQDSVLRLTLTIKEETYISNYQCDLWINLSTNILERLTVDYVHDFNDGKNHHDILIDNTYRLVEGNVTPESYCFKSKEYFKVNNEDKQSVIKANLIIYPDTFQLPSLNKYDSQGNAQYTTPELYDENFWILNRELKFPSYQTRDRFFKNYYLNRLNHSVFIPRKVTDLVTFVPWTKERLLFNRNQINVAQEGYIFRIVASTFIDPNVFNDSLHLFTKVLYCPQLSYFSYELNTVESQTFLNIYMDLLEIQRRKFVEEVHSKQLRDKAIYELFNNYVATNEKLLRKYRIQADFGRRKEKLVYWNDCVKEELGIDNIETFEKFFSR